MTAREDPRDEDDQMSLNDPELPTAGTMPTSSQLSTWSFKFSCRPQTSESGSAGMAPKESRDEDDQMGINNPGRPTAGTTLASSCSSVFSCGSQTLDLGSVVTAREGSSADSESSETESPMDGARTPGPFQAKRTTSV